MINVIIADDYILRREGIKKLLVESNDICIFGVACNVTETQALLQLANANTILLINAMLPGYHGLSLIKRLRLIAPTNPILIMALGHPGEEELASRLLRSGVNGYLHKECTTEELFKAIHKVAFGGRYMHPKIAESIAEAFLKPANTNPKDTLSNREYEILNLVKSGMTTAQIAEVLALSTRTVSTYRSRLIRKLGMNNMSQLIKFCLENTLD